MAKNTDKKKADIVYVIKNEAMPNYIKIGITNDLKQRVRSLSGTSVPVPFQVFYAKRVKNAKDIEIKLHAAFSKDRIDSGAGREFFTISVEQAAAALSIAEGEDINFDDSKITTEQEKNAIGEAISRRPPFKFSQVGISPGSVLSFSLDPMITCIVHDDKMIEFKGRVVSLSNAAMQILKSKGFIWKAVSGPGIWDFQGENLYDRRKRIEREWSEEPTDEEIQEAEDWAVQDEIDRRRGK